MGRKIITVDLNFPGEIQPVEEVSVVEAEPVDEYTAVKEEAAIGPVPVLTIPKPKRKPAPKKEVIETPIEEPL